MVKLNIMDETENLNSEFRNILTVYLKDPEEYGDYGWKSVMIDLYQLSIDPDCTLSRNTIEGLSYMYETVFHMVCKSCADKNVNDWFDKFAKAFVDGTKIPEFNCQSCRLNSKCKN